MIIVKKQFVEQEVVVDYVCNNCGESCKTEFGFKGILDYRISGGYGGTISDGDVYRFSICESCFLNLNDNFKINSYIGNEEWDDHPLEEYKVLEYQPLEFRGFIDPFENE